MNCNCLGYRLSNSNEEEKSWPNFVNNSIIVCDYSSVLYFDVLLLGTLDCSTLKWSVHEYIVHGWGTDYQAAMSNI